MSNEILWYARKRTLFGWPLSFTTYKLTDEKLMVKTGFLTTTEEEVRLYRILDFTIKKTLFGRMFGLGTIVLRTADTSTPTCEIKGVRESEKIKELISAKVEAERVNKNISSREFFGFDVN